MPDGWLSDFEGWLRTFARNKREADKRAPAGGGRGRAPDPPPPDIRLNPKDRAAAFDFGPAKRSGPSTGTDASHVPKARPGATSTVLASGRNE
jgi:hypothetical protein